MFLKCFGPDSMAHLVRLDRDNVARTCVGAGEQAIAGACACVHSLHLDISSFKNVSISFLLTILFCSSDAVDHFLSIRVHQYPLTVRHR